MAEAEPVAETVLEATVATMRKIHLCKQAAQSAGAAHDVVICKGVRSVDNRIR